MMDNQAQLRHRPVIRVFVSSTFPDLKQERDALQRDVFPKLEQLCASRQFQFQAIDLRFGLVWSPAFTRSGSRASSLRARAG